MNLTIVAIFRDGEVMSGRTTFDLVTKSVAEYPEGYDAYAAKSADKAIVTAYGSFHGKHISFPISPYNYKCKGNFWDNFDHINNGDMSVNLTVERDGKFEYTKGVLDVTTGVILPLNSSMANVEAASLTIDLGGMTVTVACTVTDSLRLQVDTECINYSWYERYISGEVKYEQQFTIDVSSAEDQVCITAVVTGDSHKVYVEDMEDFEFIIATRENCMELAELCGFKEGDSVAARDDYELLGKMTDSVIWSSTHTNSYVAPSTDPKASDELCKKVIAKLKTKG